MKAIPAVKLASVLLALFMLVGASFASAATTQTLDLTIFGGVVTADHQVYQIKGDQIVAIFVGGIPIDTSTLALRYSLDATVDGLKVRGHASFAVTSNGNGDDDDSDGDDDGKAVIKGEAKLDGSVAAFLPTGCTLDSSCTSQVPFYLTGTGRLVIQTPDGPITEDVQMLFESPYWNPFGRPIIITSADGAVLILATYSTGTIDWSKVVDAGTVVLGSVDGTSVTGFFTQRATAHEDLVAGTEVDSGKIAFVGMVPDFLNSKGEYSGTSTIPNPGVAFGATNCTPDLLVIFGADPTDPTDPTNPMNQLASAACLNTGLESTGTFNMKGSGVKISGDYSTSWFAPALAFTATITGTVTQSA